MAKTIQVWAGKGVLWHGRKKIKAGGQIPNDLSKEARKSFKAKGHIKDVVIDDDAAPAQLRAAVATAKEAEADIKQLDIEALTKAVQTAKGLRTKATKAADADKANAELATKAGEADTALTAAETELSKANTLAEAAVRLRMEADALANG